MGAYGLPALILFLTQHLLRPHNKRTHSGTIKGTWKMILNVVFLNFKTNSCARLKTKKMLNIKIIKKF